ncbi:ATP-binding protein [Pontiellaceae bacterium B1224]|nr:ATP-binding protein [Pontiellaceae bacterium B1224]
MTLLIIALISTQFITLFLGLLVYLNNKTRLVNKQFIILSIHLTTWAFCVLKIIESPTSASANFWIRGAFFVTAFFPGSFTLILSAIKFSNYTWSMLYKKLAPYLSLNLIAALLTLTPFFMNSVSISPQIANNIASVPEATYGPGYYIYAVYFIVTCLIAGKKFYHTYKESSGIERFELQYILYGFSATFIIGAFASLILPILAGTNKTSQFGPLGIILLDGIVAYGITTRRILGIATILQRITAYILLTSYLIGVYYITWQVSAFALGSLTETSERLPYLLATMAVVFSMFPVQGRFQAVANKLIASRTMDVPATMKQANLIFQSITTIDALLKQYSTLLGNALETTGVHILLANNKSSNNLYVNYNNISDSLAFDGPVCQLLISEREPVSRDTLKRTRATKLNNLAEQSLSDRNASVAIGVFAQNILKGVVLLDPRLDGRIYDRNEQDALQMLCNQFSVALENADLYTKMQDSKIQNEIMLDQLVSGVVVANPEGEITLFNHEAQRITGIEDKEAIGQKITILPKEIYLALEVTLENKNGVRNIDATLFPQEDSEESRKNIRMGSAFLFGHDGKPMGALLVFTDITELKGLEEQVRRSDQLSSVGTLAAGMAHEIKNPLVTIKTFTQLLPKRYEDEDFRNDFSSLVAHEVNRIDGIVNELLSFSKPAKPHLIPMNIQETIDQSLKLIQEQLSQKNITLTNNCRAASTHIFGDAKLLSQALINLNLNAIEAIGESGSITFGTLNCAHRFANGDSPGIAVTRKCIRLQISDTGKGIERSDLQKIFDPFFTNKSEGTGMGLSVAHGIISEHHGVIEVESEPGRGTSFYLYIPLLEEGTMS